MLRISHLVALIFLTVSLALAAPQSGKVRAVLGDVSFQKKNKTGWSALRVGAKVQEGDKIQTYLESSVNISMPDGSVIMIGENALVEFSQLLLDKDAQISEIDIQKGTVRFDVQKQKSAKSKFRFKTGTATASIRGTDGSVGLTEAGQPYGALNSGAMDMEDKGQTVSVKPQQFVAFRKDKPAVVVEAKNAGDPEFVKKLSAAVDDTTKSDEAIMAQAKELDQKIEKRNEDMKSKYSCVIDPLPQVIDSTSLNIGVTCTAGMRVSIGSEAYESKGSKLTFSPSWSKSAFGEKKFVVNCSAEGTDFECARIGFTYRVDRTVVLNAAESSKCQASFKTAGFDENEGSLQIFVDDSLMARMVLARDTSGKFKTILGEHTYKAVAENADSLAAVRGTVSKKIKCFPPTGAKIKIRGGNKEVIKKKVSQGSAFYPVVEFDLTGIPNNDPALIENVSVIVDGKAYDVEYVPSTTGIGYKSTVRVERGKSKMASVTISASIRSGEVVSATKTYEMR